MNEAARHTTPAIAQRRQTKFTPANIRQIINLLERGRSKVEIAEIIGVTPATLQVTCSKLGISLRRPAVDGTGVLRQRRPPPQNAPIPNVRELNQEAVQPASRDERIHTAPEAASVDEDHTIIRLHAREQLTESAGSNGVALAIRYNGQEKIVDLPIDRNALGLFALEAEFRSMSIGDLIGQVLLSTAKNDLFQSVLKQSHSHSKRSRDQKRSSQPPTGNDRRSDDEHGGRSPQ
jgi:hypothetical protein